MRLFVAVTFNHWSFEIHHGLFIWIRGLVERE